MGGGVYGGRRWERCVCVMFIVATSIDYMVRR